MALVFEQIPTRELGDASYLIGDESARVAAVIAEGLESHLQDRQQPDEGPRDPFAD